jgi:NitT/TauT family transport system ATP-binding protein
MNGEVISSIAIRLVNVKKHFKDRDVEALGGIYLEVVQGEFVTLIGPSGSGKSTLLELLGDIGDEGGPSEGEILIEGKTPQELRRVRGYGIVFQESTLFPWYRVFENTLLPFRIAPGDGGLGQKILVLLSKRTLRGMQQRVAIVRALALDPPLLLMDEPFGALDDLTRKTMQMLLLDIWSKTQKTILMVTHLFLKPVSCQTVSSSFHTDRVVSIGLSRSPWIGPVTDPWWRRRHLEGSAGWLGVH